MEDTKLNAGWAKLLFVLQEVLSSKHSDASPMLWGLGECKDVLSGGRWRHSIGIWHLDVAFFLREMSALSSSGTDGTGEGGDVTITTSLSAGRQYWWGPPWLGSCKDWACFTIWPSVERGLQLSSPTGFSFTLLVWGSAIWPDCWPVGWAAADVMGKQEDGMVFLDAVDDCLEYDKTGTDALARGFTEHL